MLGNAIDNAIESVDRISDAEKKTISLSIKDQGKMLYVSVENYYEGEIVIRGGYPVTHKKDKENHGFGVKSIQLIARRYGGDIRVSTAHHIFLLQIILPTASGNQASRIRRIS
ncbi:ATP-binding protein [Lachnoclostridium sp. An169]|uniref:ATP-binding protein n=1 Tax=Lachnoclostridium sp. An169 TaxID=1965569 RepID=UPI003FA53C1E